MKKYIIVIILILFSITQVFELIGCNNMSSNIYFETNCDLELKGNGSNIISQNIYSLFEDLENSLSTSITQSEIYCLNNAEANTPINISGHIKYLFDVSKTFNLLDSNFNPSIFPVVNLWHFGSISYIGAASQIPSQEQILEVLQYCTLDNFSIDYNANTLTKKSTQASIDFGAIAKGYACDLAFDKAKELKKAVINVGGTIRTNSTISVYIKNPRESENKPYAAIVNLNNESISTSGDYERFYFFEGKRYHHIIDSSGYPAGILELEPIISVSIIGPTATICDALSTLVFISGINLNTIKILNDYNCKAIVFREKSYQIHGELDITTLDDIYVNKI